jgi:hypothetical protein
MCRSIPKDNNANIHCRENLKTQWSVISLFLYSFANNSFCESALFIASAKVGIFFSMTVKA